MQKTSNFSIFYNKSQANKKKNTLLGASHKLNLNNVNQTAIGGTAKIDLMSNSMISKTQRSSRVINKANIMSSENASIKLNQNNNDGP